MARQVAAAASRYFTESVEHGDICWNSWLTRTDEDRNHVAAFVGATPSAIAFLQNASLGLNIAARSFAQPIRVLAIRPEFPSCTTPFIRAGHALEFMDTPESGYVDADMVSRAIKQHQPRLFVLSSVQFANGFRADLASIGEVCRKQDVLFVVDATQSIGAFGIDMNRDNIDALIFSGYKWATAGYGNAVLATGTGWPDSIPPLVGWRSAKQAYDLENDRLDMLSTGIGHEMGHPPFPSIFTLGEALRLLDEPDSIEMENRIVGLSGALRNGLEELGLSIRSDATPRHISGITLVDLQDAGAVKTTLQEKNVWVTARQGGLRISVHAYNNSEDIDWLLSELRPLV